MCVRIQKLIYDRQSGIGNFLRRFRTNKKIDTSGCRILTRFLRNKYKLGYLKQNGK